MSVILRLLTNGVRHARFVLGKIRKLETICEEELTSYSRKIGAPYELVLETNFFLNLGKNWR